MNNAKVYILHENEAWIGTLKKFLEEMHTPYENWFIDSGQLDLNAIPPEGIFYNRMSASSHSRDHRYSIELTESILSWLEAHGRTVVNNRNALTLEVRKSEQLIGLKKHGIPTPNSIVVNNASLVVEAAKKLNSLPFIVKPNRGGKGLGVKLYNSLEQLESDVQNETLPETLDGIWLVQEYIKPVDGRITRVELIGGEFYYAVSVDASGGFELCPADACDIEDTYCPADGNSKFRILENYINPDIVKYEQFFKESGIQVGAIEYAQSTDGTRYVYDVNTNTNYNSEAEAAINNKFQGMKKIASYLREELDKVIGISNCRDMPTNQLVSLSA